ncbi:MAG: tryptophanase [Patescibacteria group bacterium]
MNPISLADFKTAHEPRAYVNSSIRFHHEFSQRERLKAAQKAGWNVFQFPSEMLKGGDLLSDSGTTTMTVEQVAAMFLGDEAYGSNYGYFQLLETFEEVFGIPSQQTEVFFFHQGRAAEHALFSQIGKFGEHLIIPSNGHFDTTRANIENNRIAAKDCFSPQLHSKQTAPFKGNMDLAVLERILQENSQNIPLVYVTITNNSGGGQPVSLANIKAVRKLCDHYAKPLFLDACRFAENSWFIKAREKEYAGRTVRNIVKEIFALCDGFTISLKKDGLANMGGALVIKKKSPLVGEHPRLLNDIRDHQILTEGHPTYGGLSGRDIMTLCVGLKTAVTEQYLKSRIGLVHEFGRMLKKAKVPVLEPFGGHAIYLDMDKFFVKTKHQRADFGGIAFTGLLLLKGVRLCELGAFAFGENHPHNFVRAAVPRNKYELEDLAYVADCIQGLYEKRREIPRAVPVYGRDLTLRHFKARFKLEAFSSLVS